MTEDYSIQQTRPSVLPYAGVGAVAGGAAAYIANPYIGKPMSHDDIVAEVNDKDKFEGRTKEGAEHAAEWKDVKADADEVTRLKKEVEEASKPKLDPNAPEARALKAAEQDAQREIERLQREANKKAGVRTVTTSGKGTIVPYSSEWAMTPADAADYKSLHNQLVTANNNFEAKPEVKALNNKITTKKGDVSKLWESILTDAKAMIDPKGGTKRFPKPRNMSGFISEYAKDTVVDNLKRTSIVKPTYEDVVAAMGGESNLSNSFSITAEKITAPDGTIKYYNPNKAQKKDLARRVADRMNTEADRIVSQFGRYTEIKNILDDPKAIEKELGFDKGFVRQAGLVQKKGGKTISESIADWKSELAKYKTEMETIKKAGLHETRLASGTTVTNPAVQNLMTHYKKTSPSEVYGMLTARISMVEKYDAYLNGLNDELAEITSDKELKGLKEQLEKMRSSDPDIKKYEGQIRKKYNKFLKFEKVTTTEVAEGVETITEENLSQATKDKLKKLRDEYDAAAKKDGAKLVDNTAAKEAAEKELKTAEESLAKKTSELAGKIGKKPFMNKWLAAGIGAVALGLAGIAVAPKSKNA